MYLHKAEIENIRSIRNFRMTFKSDEYAGWHVIIGDNGSGKSTLVRSIALLLTGPEEAMALRQNWADWIRNGMSHGKIIAHIDNDRQFDEMSEKNASVRDIPAVLYLRRNERGGASLTHTRQKKPATDMRKYLWGDGPGWFSAAYGPFRRFTGGSGDYETLFRSHPKLAPHLSVFGEDVALTECLDWLQRLYFRQLEGRERGKQLDHLKKFINEGDLLPHNTKLEKVTSDGVVFRDGNGCEVLVEQLGDGYRSVLSITFEMIRQMIQSYGPDKVFFHIRQDKMQIRLPGVVLIDEIDAHLHPAWQRQIGYRFLRYFPEIQFIVTTHSPLICHASETGTVWKLPVPGDGESPGRIEGTERDRLVYGNVIEALDTEPFGYFT